MLRCASKSPLQGLQHLDVRGFWVTVEAALPDERKRIWDRWSTSVGGVNSVTMDSPVICKLATLEVGLDVVFLVQRHVLDAFTEQQTINNVPTTEQEVSAAKRSQGRHRRLAACMDHDDAIAFQSRVRQWKLTPTFPEVKADENKYVRLERKAGLMGEAARSVQEIASLREQETEWLAEIAGLKAQLGAILDDLANAKASGN